MTIEMWKVLGTLWLCLGISKFVAAGPMDGKNYSLIEYFTGLPLCLVIGPIWIVIDLVNGENP
jgi:hypothetical protein